METKEQEMIYWKKYYKMILTKITDAFLGLSLLTSDLLLDILRYAFLMSKSGTSQRFLGLQTINLCFL